MRNVYSPLFEAISKQCKSEDEYLLEFTRLIELYFFEYNSYPIDILYDIITTERNIQYIKIAIDVLRKKSNNNDLLFFITSGLNEIRISKPYKYQKYITSFYI